MNRYVTVQTTIVIAVDLVYKLGRFICTQKDEGKRIIYLHDIGNIINICIMYNIDIVCTRVYVRSVDISTRRNGILTIDLEFLRQKQPS